MLGQLASSQTVLRLRFAERFLIDQFSSVKNVGRIRVGGLRELSIRVWVDPIRLAANNLTIQEVEIALRGENISLPAGTLEADNIDLTLNLDKSYNDINSIKQLPIKKTGNKVILLSDVADIEFGPVCEIPLPHQICSGTHATWAQKSDLKS